MEGCISRVHFNQSINQILFVEPVFANQNLSHRAQQGATSSALIPQYKSKEKLLKGKTVKKRRNVKGTSHNK